MSYRRDAGNSLLETALLLPLLFLLLVGMTELAKITYTYYTLHKTLYTLAQYLGRVPGINLCDDADTSLAAAKSYALTGTSDNSAESNVTGLTADMLDVRLERYAADTQDLGECECSVSGCDAGTGGRAPDFIVVSIPNGYSMTPVIPYFISQTILLRPRVRVPYGGI